MAAPLLAVALCLSAAAPASAADDRNETVVSAGQSDALRVVSTAQSEVDTDPDPDSDRRLVDRESSEQVDAVVIALWTIAAVMTVMLAIFLWHTSPRRRLRLAGNGSAELSEEAEGGAETLEDESAEGQSVEGQSVEGQSVEGQSVEGQSVEGQSAEGQSVEDQSAEGQSVEDESAADEAGEDSSEGDSAEGDSGWRVWARTLPWERLRRARREDSGSAGDDSEQEPIEESEDESAVWKFSEEDGGERSV